MGMLFFSRTTDYQPPNNCQVIIYGSTCLNLYHNCLFGFGQRNCEVCTRDLTSFFLAKNCSVQFFINYRSLSLSTLPTVLYHLTYMTQSRYTGALLNEVEFHNKTSLVELQWINVTSNQKYPCHGNPDFAFGCR